jgi:hypothetical protein
MKICESLYLLLSTTRSSRRWKILFARHFPLTCHSRCTLTHSHNKTAAPEAHGLNLSTTTAINMHEEWDARRGECRLFALGCGRNKAHTHIICILHLPRRTSAANTSMTPDPAATPEHPLRPVFVCVHKSAPSVSCQCIFASRVSSLFTAADSGAARRPTFTHVPSNYKILLCSWQTQRPVYVQRLLFVKYHSAAKEF